MNRFLNYLNCFGVIALAVLCVVQWQHDRRLNREVNQLQKTRQEQQAQLTEQERTIHGLTNDLSHFKEQFSLTHSNLTASRENLRKIETENNQLQQERDQLKTSITNWANAVAARDARLEELSQRIRSLADQLNDTTRKFNDLAANYNSVVKQLNEQRTSGTNTSSQPGK